MQFLGLYKNIITFTVAAPTMTGSKIRAQGKRGDLPEIHSLNR